jgi:hypothetical protein
MQDELFQDEPQEKKKRKKPVMLTGRSRKYLEHQGYIVALVERSLDVPKFKGNPNGERFRNKFDAFGIADLAAVHPNKTGTLWVQVTDHHNGAAHIEKIRAAKHAPVLLQAVNRIELHCWKSTKRKGQLKTWCLRLQRVSLDISGADKLWFSDVEEHWFRENMQEIDDF